MDSSKLNPLNRKDNVKMLRRHLRLTQREFIDQFLCDENGKALLSIATLSNLESSGGARLTELVAIVSERLHLDPMIFSKEPDEFIATIDYVVEDKYVVSEKKNDTSQLIHRLTMYLADQMFDEKLKKNEQIESDRILAEKLGVGRTNIREALKVLEVLGMIDIRPGQGSYLSNGEGNFFNIPLSWSLFMNGNQTDDIVETRNILEVKAAALAASCDKQEKLDRLTEVYGRMKESLKTQNYKEFLQEDVVFHTCIADCSENQVIFSMLQTISNFMKHISQTGMVEEGQLQDIYEEHKAIYNAIMNKEAVLAEKAMEEHLNKSAKRYKY